METPREIRDKINRKMIYCLRGCNPYIMGMGGIMFFAGGVGGGVLGRHKGEPCQAVLMIAVGLVFFFIFLVLRQALLDGCLRRLSEGQGEAPPGPPIKKSRQLRFDKALDLGLDNRGKYEITPDGITFIPVFEPLMTMKWAGVQYRLRVHGKDKTVEKYILKIHT